MNTAMDLTQSILSKDLAAKLGRQIEKSEWWSDKGLKISASQYGRMFDKEVNKRYANNLKNAVSYLGLKSPNNEAHDEAMQNTFSQMLMWSPRFQDYIEDELIIVWGDGFLTGLDQHPGDPLSLTQAAENISSVIIGILTSLSFSKEIGCRFPEPGDHPNNWGRMQEISQRLLWVLENHGFGVKS